jgi:hypothetical protein
MYSLNCSIIEPMTVSVCISLGIDNESCILLAVFDYRICISAAALTKFLHIETHELESLGYHLFKEPAFFCECLSDDAPISTNPATLGTVTC